MKRHASGFVFLLVCGAATAEPWLDDESLRVGGGIGVTRVDGVARSTLELFAGRDVLRHGPYRVGVEIGVVDVDETHADTVFASGVADWQAADDVNLFARGGLDFGGGAGWLLGAGVGYTIEPNMAVRAEVLGRDRGNLVQLNLTYYPNRSPFP